jgi:hypothetical protein
MSAKPRRKLAAFALTPEPASHVAPPLVVQCFNEMRQGAPIGAPTSGR